MVLFHLSFLHVEPTLVKIFSGVVLVLTRNLILTTLKHQSPHHLLDFKISPLAVLSFHHETNLSPVRHLLIAHRPRYLGRLVRGGFRNLCSGWRYKLKHPANRQCRFSESVCRHCSVLITSKQTLTFGEGGSFTMLQQFALMLDGIEPRNPNML